MRPRLRSTRVVPPRLSRGNQQHQQAHGDFRQMEDLYSLNCILLHYVRRGDAPVAWELFCNMHRSGLTLDAYTFTSTFSACAAHPGKDSGAQAHALMLRTGSISPVSQTSLMHMYSNLGVTLLSVTVFHEISVRDMVAWNSLLLCLLRNWHPCQALHAFTTMREQGQMFNDLTLCSLLKACAMLRYLSLGKQVHALMLGFGCTSLVVPTTALIDFYSQAGGDFNTIVFIFSRCIYEPDGALSNAFLSACVTNSKFDMAFQLFRRIRRDAIAVATVLTACSHSSDLHAGKQVHAFAVRSASIATSVLVCNTLLHMYAKCGEIRQARRVFEGMAERDVVSWTSMIDAYGRHGRGVESFELYQRMGGCCGRDIPNRVTLLAVLSACGHSGLVKQGRECLASFRERCGVEPGPEHIACFVDGLGRAGLVEDAWLLVKEMEKPSTAVWIAFLNACGVNRDMEKGVHAAERLLELEKEKAEIWVLVSNFYAAMGMWDAVCRIRDRMDDMGVVHKQAGNSRVASV